MLGLLDFGVFEDQLVLGFGDQLFQVLGVHPQQVPYKVLSLTHHQGEGLLPVVPVLYCLFAPELEQVTKSKRMEL